MAAMKITNDAKKGVDAQIVGLPCLLQGEVILSSCQKVLKFSSMSKQGSGVMGSLHVTNFKLAFTTANIGNSQGSTRRMSQSLKKKSDLFAAGELHTGDHIPLTCISGLIAVSTSKNKMKVLTSNKVPSSKYDILEVVCKDFRIIQFDMSLCSNAKRNFMSTLVHHAFPDTVPRLFAFDYCSSKFKANSPSLRRAFHTFRHSKDYELLLTSQGAQKFWRVSQVNSGFSVSKTLPELNVFPVELPDEEIHMLSQFYEDGRLPTWEWSDDTHGVPLLTCGSLRPSRSAFYSTTHDKSIGHPQLIVSTLQNTCSGLEKTSQVEIVSVMEYFPTIQELQRSFVSLRKTCCCRSSEDYWSSDANWLSKVENSRWMEFVQASLKCTLEVIEFITEQKSPVILQEPSGRDFTCVVSSLVQISLDPFFRTILGLQSLIQKSWVAKGHKFLDRVAHLHSRSSKKIKPVKTETTETDGEDSNVNIEESPVFLLFINCLRNLVAQNPTYFEYNENFLIMLADNLYACLFDTFLFNSEFQRKQLAQDSTLETLWDFVSNEVPSFLFEKTFVNPLVKLSSLEREYQCLKEKASTNKVNGYDSGIAALNSDHGLGQSSETSSEVFSNSDSVSDDLNLEKQHLLPEIPIVDNEFWRGYFLRWLPKFDAGEDLGGELSLALQQKAMVEELEYLEDRLLRLHSVQENNVFNDGTASQKSLSWRRRNKSDRRKDDLDKLTSATSFSFYTMLHNTQQ